MVTSSEDPKSPRLLTYYSSDRVPWRNSRVAAHQAMESFQAYRLGLHRTIPLLKRSAVSSLKVPIHSQAT
jgi:hypothetical protein